MQVAANYTVYFDDRGKNYKSRSRGSIGTKKLKEWVLLETRGDGSC